MLLLKSKRIAKNVHDVLVRCNGELNDSIALVKETCSEEEFLEYRQIIGKIMGEIVVEALMPIYKQHPELDLDNDQN